MGAGSAASARREDETVGVAQVALQSEHAAALAEHAGDFAQLAHIPATVPPVFVRQRAPQRAPRPGWRRRVLGVDRPVGRLGAGDAVLANPRAPTTSPTAASPRRVGLVASPV